MKPRFWDKVRTETFIWRIVVLCLLSALISTKSYQSFLSYLNERSVIFSVPELDLKLANPTLVREQSEPNQLNPLGRNRNKQDPEKSWNSWTTRAAEWRRNTQLQNVDPNWPGRQRMNNALRNGSLWWDEDFEVLFFAELEKSQFPTDCKKHHVLGHRSHNGGLLSNVHVYGIPLLIGSLRGYPVLDIPRNGPNTAYYGCPPEISHLGCYFNLTSCDIEEYYGNQTTHHLGSVTYDYALLEPEESFPLGNFTFVEPFRKGRMGVCIGPIYYEEALDYYKVKLMHKLTKKGLGTVGVHGEKYACTTTRIETRRLDFLMISMISGWMLSKTSERVKLVADKIMARYADKSGRPLWNPPVLGIHIRQTDKAREDPYWNLNHRYRDVADYVARMKDLEEEHGFQWPSLFITSDSGTAIELLTSIINGGAGNASMTPNGTDLVDNGSSSKNSNYEATSNGKRLIMYDWLVDTHLVEKYGTHAHVPEELKRETQEHFLATLYIFSKICDYGIVTYSSNVGRFIGEIMASQQRMVNPDAFGPVTMSLDIGWGRD